MPFIEAPTTFYMGRRYDPASHRLTDDVVYYDSRDLTTHAVVVGMTGSGKTGLCITLLEEAILDNLPAIVIDPKGDITNLLLTFPELAAADFQQWINLDDARRAGLEPPAYAADIAQRWRDGLQNWGIVPDRLRWLQHAARYSIYTPGSDSGLPVSILASLAAPRGGWAGNEEAHRERINGVVTALLGLIGVDAKPVQDREHVLVANIFEHAWSRGQDLTLEEIILQVQKPPFARLGVFPVDEYIAEKDRYKLAMDLNNIIAAPSFQSWIAGEPMDMQHLLYQPDGRPRVSIFYIAHLSEPERLFITTLLLENMLSWMRTLSGTTSLRALLYIDEMYGYFPPYPRNPPTKEPLLRLLKQARAFGVGLLLATQNPGDLDYKGLSNAGTWFIGRLQSENDKQRVLNGLQTVASADMNLDIRQVSRLLSDLDPRVFLMHNVHNEGGPVLLHTRWAMSFLRGPLTRQQIQTLMADQRQQLASAPATQTYQSAAGAPGDTLPGAPPAHLPETPPHLPELDAVPGVRQPGGMTGGPTRGTVAGAQAGNGFAQSQPPIPSSIAQFFLPAGLDLQAAISRWEQRTSFAAQQFGGATLAYRPALLAQVTIRYADRKTATYTARTLAYHLPHVDRAGLVHWDEHRAEPIDPKRVSGEPLNEAVYGELPPGLTDGKRMTQLKRELVDMLYTTAQLKVPYNPALDLYANPDGSFSEFRAQVTQAAREKRDAEIDALTSKYEGIMDKLEDRLRRKMQKLETEKKELEANKRIELFTTGEALLSLLRGRTTYTLSRMARASLFRHRTHGDVELYEQGLADVYDDIGRTEQEFEQALQEVNQRWAQAVQQTEEYLISPYKKDILVDLFGVGWVPHWYVVVNDQPLLLPAT